MPPRTVVRVGRWSTSGPQVLNLGLSAWELACHVFLTGAPQVSCHPRLSVSDRRIPVLTALSGTQRARRLPGAFWMQISGAIMLATKRRCLVRVLMAVPDGRSAYGLLYIAAVRDDRSEQEHCQGRVYINLVSLTAQEELTLGLQEIDGAITMTLNAFSVFLYTTLGGMIGAGLTQYVTHLRDRRVARATIIERVANAEAQYVVFGSRTSGLSPEERNAALSQFNSTLASVEAACLIAGVPRANVMVYIVSRQMSAQVKLTESFATLFASDVDRLRKAAGDMVPTDRKAHLDRGMLLAEALQKKISEINEIAERLDPSAFDTLRRSVWHPFMVQLRRRELHKLQRTIIRLEDQINPIKRELMKAETERFQLEIDEVRDPNSGE